MSYRPYPDAVLRSTRQEYYETVEELGTEELLVSQLQQDLQSISSADVQVAPAFEDELNKLQSQAQETQKRLSEMDPDSVTVSSDLAEVILDIESLNREFNQVKSKKVVDKTISTFEPISSKIRKYSEQTVKVEFERGGDMILDLGRVSQDHTKPLKTEVYPVDGSNRPYQLKNSEPQTPVFLEVVNPRDGSSDIIGEIESVTVL